MWHKRRGGGVFRFPCSRCCVYVTCPGRGREREREQPKSKLFTVCRRRRHLRLWASEHAFIVRHRETPAECVCPSFPTVRDAFFEHTTRKRVYYFATRTSRAHSSAHLLWMCTETWCCFGKSCRLNALNMCTCVNRAVGVLKVTYCYCLIQMIYV